MGYVLIVWKAITKFPYNFHHCSPLPSCHSWQKFSLCSKCSSFLQKTAFSLIKSWLALGSGTWLSVVITSYLPVLVQLRIIWPVKVHQKMRKIATKQPNWAKIGPNGPKFCVLYAKKCTTTGSGGSDWYEIYCRHQAKMTSFTRKWLLTAS